MMVFVMDKFRDVAAWLQRLGMSEYVDRFAENRIDLSVLHDLTDEDLKRLGIATGARRTLLPAIRQLGRNSSSQSSTCSADAARRQLTVIFCGPIGSTPPSPQLDPEPMREGIAAYHRRCAAIVEQ